MDHWMHRITSSSALLHLDRSYILFHLTATSVLGKSRTGNFSWLEQLFFFLPRPHPTSAKFSPDSVGITFKPALGRQTCPRSISGQLGAVALPRRQLNVTLYITSRVMSLLARTSYLSRDLSWDAWRLARMRAEDAWRDASSILARRHVTHLVMNHRMNHVTFSYFILYISGDLVGLCKSILWENLDLDKSSTPVSLQSKQLKMQHKRSFVEW